MNSFPVVLGLVGVQRAAELVLAAVNTRRLRGLGGREIDAAGYKWIVLLHAGWLAAMAATIPIDAPASWPLLGIYAGLQAARLWVIASLGRRWTTRVIVLPGTPLVRSGPYRYLRHPNYAVVAAEIAVLPLAFGAVAVAILCSLGNLGLTLRRIRIEDTALAPATTG
ncbi:MAG TPA: isoprenylcysteine carboxylmethyltransferase family protein [Stellaceae bacterium]|jgi:methyltransferase|nr:isoprenylcysteine carboxylmethyltransferase family protein [Stellaceae bacterium]